MGMKITCDEDAAIPRNTVLVLICDGDHGLFASSEVTFDHGGYGENHRAAMAAGWLERDGGNRGRLWLCPECSGKKVCAPSAQFRNSLEGVAGSVVESVMQIA